MTTSDSAETIACPAWCTRPPDHIVVDDLDRRADNCGHNVVVATVVGIHGGTPVSAIVEVDRADSYHPETGYVRDEEAVVVCDAGELLTATMARELAAALLEAAELADSSG